MDEINWIDDCDSVLDKCEIFGFSGKTGSGKDYIAREIFARLMKARDPNIKSMFMAFADPLKAVCAARYNLGYDDLYVKKVPETRKKLQEVGDDIRSQFSEMYFVNAIKFEIEKQYYRNNITRFFITDVRFPEELKFIQNMGGYVLRVNAPDRSSVNLLNECLGNEEIAKKRSEHRSETLLDNATFDGFIQNEKDDDPLEQCVIWMMEHL